MRVYFIGAGPGAADLITVRGMNAIRNSQVILYAGSLVPQSLLSEAPSDALILDTACLNLEEIFLEIKKASKANKNVARVHSGDPSLYGAIGEQMRLLDTLNINYEIIPGVPAYAAAAAALKRELTLPGICQTIILTRTSTRSSPMPKGEKLRELAKIGATLVIHLSINNLKRVVKDISPYYTEDCPVVVAYRVTWPDEIIIWGSLKNIHEKVKKSGITRTALIMVGKAINETDFDDSQLYDPKHHHIFRSPKKSHVS